MNTEVLKQSQSVEPVIYMPGFGAVAARKMTIASVHFWPSPAIRFMHSGRKEFVLPPAKRGEVKYVHVYDSQQLVPDTAALATLSAGEEYPAPLPMPVRVETIVADLVRNWTTGFSGVMGKHRPGIMSIKGDTATEEEKAKMFALEEKLCRAAVDEADGIERGKGEKGAVITDFHRACLDWLDSEKRSWYKPIERGHSKLGVCSGQRIPMEALSDGGQDILEYYVKYDLDPLDYEDLHVASMFEKNPNLKKKILDRIAGK